VTGNKRERELARAKYERQQARREQEAAKRRRRYQVVTAVVVSVLVVGALIALPHLIGPSSNEAAATTAPSASTTGTPTASASTNAVPIPTDGSNATCSYPAGGGTATKTVSAPPASAPTRPATGTATLNLNGKPVTISLLRSKAPCTVNSFAHLVQAKFYDKTPCHRLTTGALAVLQCGDPGGTGSGGPGYTFADENLTGATYPAGTVAMANSGADTNGSQFFLVYKDSTLPPSYTPFGKIVGGMDVLDAIGAAGVKGGGSDGAPATPVTITSASIGG
jgi:peptidyl-prolyl cis-trans isomerase B (cyclophilin B)